MVKRDRMQRMVLGALVVMLVASFALAVIAFVAPPPVRAGPPQPMGWECWGAACWCPEDSCSLYSPLEPCYHCTNWCRSVPGDHWACLGTAECVVMCEP